MSWLHRAAKRRAMIRDAIYRALLTRWPPRRQDTALVMMRSAVQAGALPAVVGAWIKNAVDLAELRLRNVMVPRVDVVAIPDKCTAQEAAGRMALSGHRRLPVYRDSLDHPIGMLHALDVAKVLARPSTDGSPPIAAQLARPTPILAETLPVPEALETMRQEATWLVLVVNDRAGLAGLVTLEDIVEQIVGPIPDEYGDKGRREVRVVGPRELIVGAVVPLQEVEHLLDVRLPRIHPISSIGGLVYDRLGRVPHPGDVVELAGTRIEVLSVDGVKLRELRVTAQPGTTPTNQPRADTIGNRAEQHTSASPGEPGRKRTSAGPRRLVLPVGSEVVKRGVTVGRLERLIVDPTTGQVTHLVVRHEGRSVLVPVSWVEREEDELVSLSPSAGDLDLLPIFDPAEYLEAGPDHPTLDGGRSPGDVVFSLGGSSREIRSRARASEGVTPDRAGQPAVHISTWTDVMALDGPAGRVKYLLLDGETGTVSHVVVRLRQGLLARHDVLVPLAWATRITSEYIELAVRCDELAALPEFHFDEEIGDEIWARLHDDARFQGVDFYGIDVQVEGGVARLRGHVRRADLKQAAEEIAAAVPGVLGVENELVADDQLAAQVERALRADVRLEIEDLEVVALLGMVELRGRVASPGQCEAAAETARRVPGVEDVVSKLEVARPEVGSTSGVIADGQD